jgi:hypothetical protein
LAITKRLCSGQYFEPLAKCSARCTVQTHQSRRTQTQWTSSGRLPGSYTLCNHNTFQAGSSDTRERPQKTYCCSSHRDFRGQHSHAFPGQQDHAMAGKPCEGSRSINIDQRWDFPMLPKIVRCAASEGFYISGRFECLSQDYRRQSQLRNLPSRVRRVPGVGFPGP